MEIELEQRMESYIQSKELMTGYVVYYDSSKHRSYGFIRPDIDGLPNIFVGFTDIEPEKEGFKSLLQGDKVKFNLSRNNRGFKAINVYVIRSEQNEKE